MLEESGRRLSDAKRLAHGNIEDPFSDSAHLLSLLAFELLLKLVFEISTEDRAPQHHKYKVIFQALPKTVRDDVESLARGRVGPDAFATSLEAILDEWSTNFVDLRYPYERYSEMSEEQYAQRSGDWAARGGPLAEADFRYHPEALFGMTEALNQVAARHG